MRKGDRSNRIAIVAAIGLLATGLAVSASPMSALAEGNESLGAPAPYRELAAGGTHTCAILNAGRVKCWGNNTSGRLGLGDTLARGDAAGEMGDNLPSVDLGFGRTATALAAGAGHSCALLDNGQVKCWGNNTSGRLGLGDTLARGDAAGEMGDSLPAVNLGTGRVATSVSAGNNHTCAVLDDGTVKCWGNNGSGQLGLGDVAARGDAAGEMGNALPAVQLGTGRTAIAISAGNGFTCALLDNGAVKCWGDNANGRLGLGNTLDRGDAAGEMGNALPAVSLGSGRTAVAITAGDSHACALLDDGTVKCWGNNGSGRLGLGDVAARGDAAGEMGDSLPTVQLGTGRLATGITAGDTHTCARLDDGTAKCWGENDFGRLGLGNTADRGDAAGEMGNALPAVQLGTGRTATAITAGGTHTCATLDSGLRKCWGRNASGQLGLGNTADRGDAAGEMGNSLPTIDLGPGRRATALSSGAGHACAVLDTAVVKCWGDNDHGQLGLGDTVARGDGPAEMGDTLPAIALGSGRSATAITSGGAFNCALLDNGAVKCWGRNESGRLGLGDTANRGDGPAEMGDNLATVSLGTGRTATAVSAGFLHACALLDDGNVKCWGDNEFGQLGLGDTADRGDGPGEMGNSLPTVSLGTGRTALSISAGAVHSCAVLDNGTVKCWGFNADGALGLGDTASRGDGPGEMGDSLPAAALGTGRTAVDVAASFRRTCALLDNASVKCWGANDSGQLGLGDTADRGDAPAEMGDNLPAVALGTGRTAVALGLPNTNSGSSSCALLDAGTVKCWGGNIHGQLGLGDTTLRGSSPAHMGDNLPAVDLGAGRTATAVVSSGHDACAVLDTGRVKCWGFNGSGRLGLGDTIQRGDQPGEMGDALPAVDLGSPLPMGVSGTVTTTGTGERIPGAMVALLRTTDFVVVGGAQADVAGNYAAEVPPGSYFAYAIDAAGRHTPGFAGSPTAVTVATAGLVDTDAGLAPTTGAIVGKVDEVGTGDALPGVWALALSGTTGAPEVASPTDAGGQFAIEGLAPGTHFIGWIDPGGDHPVRFAPNSTDVAGATPVAVTGGDETESLGSLPTQPGTPGGAELKGTVTEEGSGAAVPQVLAIALHAADFRLARVATTGADGAYSLDLQAGSYKLAFLPSRSGHAMEWHSNQPYFGIDQAANVTAPSTANAALSPTTGGIVGRVTAVDTGRGLVGGWALAIGPTGIAGGSATRPDGGYAIRGLAPGSYRIAFLDPLGGRTQEYFDDSADFGGATPVAVVAGATAIADATMG